MEAAKRGVPIVKRVARRTDSSQRWQQFRFAVQAFRLLRRESIDVVHASELGAVRWLVPVCLLLGIPIVVHVHLNSSAVDRRYSLAERASVIVGVSDSALHGFAEDGVPASRLLVIHNGVSEDRLLTDGADDPWQPAWREHRPVVGFVGSLVPGKAVDVLVRATAAGSAFGGGWNLLLLGAGPERERLETLANELRIDDRVVFAGQRRDVGRLLRNNVTLYAAVSLEEMLPLNVLEAMTLGLPVLASDIPGHREALGPCAMGYVPTANTAATAGAISEALRRDNLRKVAGECARHRARERFSIEQYVNAFGQLYERLAPTRPSAQ